MREACTLKGIGLDSVIEQLEAANAAPTDLENNPALLPPVGLEEDLHRHIHLESSVLFPQALAMSKAG